MMYFGVGLSPAPINLVVNYKKYLKALWIKGISCLWTLLWLVHRGADCFFVIFAPHPAVPDARVCSSCPLGQFLQIWVKKKSFFINLA